MTDAASQDVIERLKLHLIDAKVGAVLRKNAAFILTELSHILDDFYDHIITQPGAAAFFRDRAHMLHAKEKQLKHWSIIAEGKFDQAYISSVQKIGRAHSRLGLEPSFFIGGYSFVLSRLIEAVEVRPTRHQAGRHSDVARLQSALVKAALLDMDIAISMYFGMERHDRQQKIADQTIFNSRHDALTGLPNRNGIGTLLPTSTTESGALSKGWAVLAIDLDRFHQINDKFGTTVGDTILKDLATVIKAHVRPADIVVRLPGDEFAVIIPTVIEHADVSSIASRILREIGKPNQYEGHSIRIGACIGAYFVQSDSDSIESAMYRAETALKHAIGRGRGSVSFYSSDMHDRMDEFAMLSDDIARAIEHNEFITFFQPKFRSEDLSICGAEVLLRWQHPTRGLLNPGSFLQAARELNFAGALDEIVLEQVEHHYREWGLLGISPGSLAMNLSLERLADPDFLKRLKSTTLPKSALIIELLESSFLDDASDDALRGLEELRACGIEWEIDDFGTGRSSILGLIRLAPSCAKIDRQFVPCASPSSAQLRILEAMIAIAKSLDMKVTVEGVEKPEQIEILQHLGCDFLQGFGLGKPMPADEFQALIQSQHDGSAPVSA